MHTSTLILFASAAALTLAANAKTMEGYTIVPASWQIEVSPGRVETLNGTIQEAIAQAVAINPDYKAPVVEPDVSPAQPLSRVRSLQKREVEFCWELGWAEVEHLQAGVNYLRGVGGSPNMAAGPRVCSRVSCSYNAAIFLCNDNNVPFTVPRGWHRVADSAQSVLNYCGYVIDNEDNHWTSGQNFEIENWNTLLKWDRC